LRAFRYNASDIFRSSLALDNDDETLFLLTCAVFFSERKIKIGAAFVVGDQQLLDVLVDRRLYGRAEARPMLMPSASRLRATTKPRPSPKPPDATIGIFILSAAAGIRMRPGMSPSPG